MGERRGGEGCRLGSRTSWEPSGLGWRWPPRLEVPARSPAPAVPALLGAGRCALRAGVVGQLREGAHRVRGGPCPRRTALATGGAPAGALQLLALGRAPSPPPAGLRAAHRVSPRWPRSPTAPRPRLGLVWRRRAWGAEGGRPSPPVPRTGLPTRLGRAPPLSPAHLLLAGVQNPGGPPRGRHQDPDGM